MAVLKDWAGRMCGGGGNAHGNARRTFGDGSRRRTPRPDGNHTYKNDRFCRRIRRPSGAKVAENRRISSYVQKSKKIRPYTPLAGCGRASPSSIMAPWQARPAPLRTPGAPPRKRRLRTVARWCTGPRRHGAGTAAIGQGGSESHWFHSDLPPKRRRHGT